MASSKYVIIFIFCLYLLSPIYAQSSFDTINSNDFNITFLENIIHQKVDSVRWIKKLYPLLKDSILYLAAKNHASYLLNNKQISHFQVNSKYLKDPLKRVQYFGRNDLIVGENIELTYYNTPVKDKFGKVWSNITYNELANNIVDGWVRSPDHYHNMIDKGYVLGSVAIDVDKKNLKIIAVQVFGQPVSEKIP